jgi:hypothetical protein
MPDVGVPSQGQDAHADRRRHRRHQRRAAAALARNITPVGIGNLIGGAVLVVLPLWYSLTPHKRAALVVLVDRWMEGDSAAESRRD